MIYEAAEKNSVLFKTIAVTGPADPRPFFQHPLRERERILVRNFQEIWNHKQDLVDLVKLSSVWTMVLAGSICLTESVFSAEKSSNPNDELAIVDFDSHASQLIPLPDDVSVSRELDEPCLTDQCSPQQVECDCDPCCFTYEETVPLEPIPEPDPQSIPAPLPEQL